MTVKRITRYFIVLFFILISSGCSVKLTYKFLDNLMSWQLGRYVSLNSEQKDRAERMFDEFHEWHRVTQLPIYADYLVTLKAGIVSGKVTGKYLHEESNKLQDMMDVSTAYLLPGLTDIAATLSAEQLEDISKKLLDERNDYIKDFVDASEKRRKKKRIKDVTRFIGPFFGRFTDDQKAVIDAWEANLIAYEHLMTKQQENWEQEFLAAMAFQDNKPMLQESLRQLMLYRTDNWDPDLQQRLDTNQKDTFAMLATLFNSQTPAQRKKLSKKFDQIIEDFRELASKK